MLRYHGWDLLVEDFFKIIGHDGSQLIYTDPYPWRGFTIHEAALFYSHLGFEPTLYDPGDTNNFEKIFNGLIIVKRYANIGHVYSIIKDHNSGIIIDPDTGSPIATDLILSSQYQINQVVGFLEIDIE